MNIIDSIQHSFSNYLSTTFELTPEQCTEHTLTLNTDESKAQFGDLSSNSAMTLAKQLKKNPRELATTIVTGFKHPHVAKIEIAGPGFLNLFLTQAAFNQVAIELYTKENNFFKLADSVAKKRYNIEFVSANPTGPMHFGHGRGGIIGDVLGTVLSFLGHTVNKEFYINDAGAQIQKLGKSLHIRCQQILGMNVELPEDAYHGEYLIALAHKAFQYKGNDLLSQPMSFFEEFGKEHMLADVKDTLNIYGIHFDTFFSEKTLHVGGAIDEALKVLDARGYLFNQEGATWFKSTTFGDDKDRVVRKATGELTYVAADIAYLQNKVDRGADHIIMTLGHDHHSYEVRLHSVRQASGITQPLDIILYQLVKMKADGQQVRMSKRAGNIVTLRDIIETVGPDVARFFYLNRKADAQLEFDLELALKTTEENPVYYAQYAYVRTNSILQKAQELPELQNITEQDAQYLGAEEQFLIKKIVDLKSVLMGISTHFNTHLLAYYTIELAQVFHRYYAHNRILETESVAKSRARLFMIQLLNKNFARCFDLLGISKPTKM